MEPKFLYGMGGWYNQYCRVSLADQVRRAVDGKLSYMVIKYGYPRVERAFEEAGIPWGTERFVYPDQPLDEATMLANAVDAGARFAVINAEAWAGWRETDERPMMVLLDELYRRHPNLEVYASIDSRGSRNALPFQRVLLWRCAAVMPMVYPLAFYGYDSQGRRITPPADYVARSFRDSLNGKDFFGKPVYPTIQTYDGIGELAVRQQIAEVHGRKLPGYNVYTLGHATNEEWWAVKDDIEKHRPPPPECQKEKWEIGILRVANRALADQDWATLENIAHAMRGSDEE